MERGGGIYQESRSPEPLNGSFWRRSDYAVMKGALKIITGDSRQIYTHIEKTIQRFLHLHLGPPESASAHGHFARFELGC